MYPSLHIFESNLFDFPKQITYSIINERVVISFDNDFKNLPKFSPLKILIFDWKFSNPIILTWSIESCTYCSFEIFVCWSFGYTIPGAAPRTWQDGCIIFLKIKGVIPHPKIWNCTTFFALKSSFSDWKMSSLNW